MGMEFSQVLGEVCWTMNSQSSTAFTPSRLFQIPLSPIIYKRQALVSNTWQSCKGPLTRPSIYEDKYPFPGCKVDGRIRQTTFSTLGAFAGCKPPSDKADLEVPVWRCPGSTSISKQKHKQKQAGEQSDTSSNLSCSGFNLSPLSEHIGAMGYLLSQLFMLYPFHIGEVGGPLAIP